MKRSCENITDCEVKKLKTEKKTIQPCVLSAAVVDTKSARKNFLALQRYFKDPARNTVHPCDYAPSDYDEYVLAHKAKQRKVNALRVFYEVQFCYNNFKHLGPGNPVMKKISNRLHNFGDDIIANTPYELLADMKEASPFAAQLRLLIRIADTRQSMDEKRQFRFIREHCVSLGELENLPTGGSTPRFYKNKATREVIIDKASAKQHRMKSGYTTAGMGKTFDGMLETSALCRVFACKTTSDSGGAQTNQCNDLFVFVSCAQEYVLQELKASREVGYRFYTLVDGAEGRRDLRAALDANPIPAECHPYISFLSCAEPRSWQKLMK